MAAVQWDFDLGDVGGVLKALSIRQPWASLIMAGTKDIENRTWKTDYRGVLVIHASRIEPEAFETYGHLLLEEIPTGSIIGTVRLVDCVRDHESEWAIPGQWHWVLTDPRPCRPRAAKGKFQLWTPEISDWAWVRRTRVSRRQPVG